MLGNKAIYIYKKIKKNDNKHDSKDTRFCARKNQRKTQTNTRPWAQIRPPEIKCAVCSIIHVWQVNQTKGGQ